MGETLFITLEQEIISGSFDDSRNGFFRLANDGNMLPTGGYDTMCKTQQLYPLKGARELDEVGGSEGHSISMASALKAASGPKNRNNGN